MILFAAAAGALIVGGIVLFFAELTRRAPAPGTPAGRGLRLEAVTGRDGRKILAAVVVGLAILLDYRLAGRRARRRR